jgi:hypothetical protein
VVGMVACSIKSNGRYSSWRLKMLAAFHIKRAQQNSKTKSTRRKTCQN